MQFRPRVDPTAYRPPSTAEEPARELGVDPHCCIRVAVTVATVWVYPWSERDGATTFAHVERGESGPEEAHLAPGTVEALLEIGTTSTVPLLSSPAWPVIDGPTPTPSPSMPDSDTRAYEPRVSQNVDVEVSLR